jgi:uncharacterized membrane protein YkvA (DUF1232 family)
MAENGFAEAMREALLSLPQDLKAMLRVMEDPDLDDEARVLASGALLHALSASNAIPGMKGTLALVDDVLVLRLALERMAQISPDVVARHRADVPEVFGEWSPQLDAARTYLGERGISVLEKALEGLPRMTHQGHSATECARDEDAATWLYDSVHEAIVEQFEISPAEVTRAVKSSHEILAKVSQRP